MSETVQSNTTESVRYTGKVKWFNNKSGFGFITVCDGEHGGKDIFVHYSSIRGDDAQYKYLVQGEYVDFDLVKANNDKHEYHAVNISGVKGGIIMCETRKLAMSSQTDSRPVPARVNRDDSGPRTYRTRPPYRQSNADSDGTRAPRTPRTKVAESK
jgi:CspA family cold shock protein